MLLQTDTFIVAGCPFTVGNVYTPCVKVQWVTAATRVKANSTPVLLSTSQGLCLNAAQVPQGKATVVTQQMRAGGQ